MRAIGGGVREVRCSFLPTLIACSPSGEAPTVVIDEKSEAGALGTAAHDVMARQVRGGAPVMVAEVAAEHGVDAGELGDLIDTGGKLLDTLRGPADCEEGAEDELTAEVCGVRLTGHRDYWWRLGDRAGLVDWKTGYKDADYRDQAMGYATLMFANFPTLRTIDVTIAWLRDGTTESYHVTLEDTHAWYLRLSDAITNDGVYHPGEHCTYCPRRYECPALAQRQTSTLAVWNEGKGRTLATMTPAERIDLYARASEVAKLAEAVRAEIREDLRQHGPLVTDDATLALVPEVHRAVDPLRAWPVLEEHFTPEQMNQIVKVSLEKATDAYARRSKAGMKAADKRDLIIRLDAAKAIRRVTTFKAKLVRK